MARSPLIRTLLAASCLAGAAALAQPADPAGTQPIKLLVGESKVVHAPPAAQGICDDPSIVQPKMTDAGFEMTALAPGTTLCALRDAAGLPSGVFRVKVAARSKPAGRRGDQGIPSSAKLSSAVTGMPTDAFAASVLYLAASSSRMYPASLAASAAWASCSR